MRTALLAGATGLIGNQLLTLLLASDRYDKVIAISRSPLKNVSTKLKNVVTGFETLADFQNQFQADDVFCCLGTTIKKAKSKEAFRQIDLEYPVLLAKLCKEKGAKQYLIVSALGANSDSSIFYNQVKGLAEEAVKGVGYPCLHILRPSLLLGDRTDERAGETTAKRIYSIFGFMIPKKYASIDSIKVARAMLNCASRDLTGTFVHESAELQAY